MRRQWRAPLSSIAIQNPGLSGPPSGQDTKRPSALLRALERACHSRRHAPSGWPLSVSLSGITIFVLYHKHQPVLLHCRVNINLATKWYLSGPQADSPRLKMYYLIAGLIIVTIDK
jgi:hypothetical protein